MKIGGRGIGGIDPPYIIAEISGNHGGSLSNAVRLIKEAKAAGADAVKTQCYEPDTITLDCVKPDFIVQSGLWRGQSLYELYTKAHTPFHWHPTLYKAAHDEGITIFSSVFDYSSVDMLESLGAPAYKIASFEIVDTPLIERVRATGKPVIISTGLASPTEILDANEASGGEAAFLHCTSEYPAAVEDANLSRMQWLDDLLKHQNPIGISDHTRSDLVAVAATALSATIIEKHLRLDSVDTEDHEFSMTPLMFGGMVAAVRAIHAGLRPPVERQYPSKQFRRSLYAVAAIKEGEEFTTQNIRSIRPGYGLPPKMLMNLLGKTAKKSYRRGDPLQ